jgi:hypothetical protein
MTTFVLERAALCTVLWSVEQKEIRVKIGDETLTPRDLEAINAAIVEVLRERAQVSRTASKASRAR